MRFTLLVIGRSKFPFVQAGLEHYKKNIGHMAEFDYIELKDAGSDAAKEAEAFLAALKKRKLLGDGKARIFLLDEKGSQFSSVAFAAKLGALRDQGVQQMIFLIGGAYGFSSELRHEFELLSLSSLTFPHDLARLILAEQLYRTLHIWAGGKYHHA